MQYEFVKILCLYSLDCVRHGRKPRRQILPRRGPFVLRLDWLHMATAGYPDRDIIRAATRENLSSGFLTSSETNRAVQPQKMARNLNFRFWVVEEMYYLCSENKGADQLCDYCTADLRLCFHICKKRFSHGVAQLFLKRC